MGYPCSDEREREAMTRAPTFVGYLSADGTALTTWPGGHLATIHPVGTTSTAGVPIPPRADCGPGMYGTPPTPTEPAGLASTAAPAWSSAFAGCACVPANRVWHRPVPRYGHRRATHAGQRGAFDLYCRGHARQALDLNGWTSTALPPRARAQITA
ncbi:hypothetical protein KUTG_09958 [Kutzneria sp. 744]|nr:hypothetical protein KUTG_09958 [Kutzneria sp. 744]